MSTEVWYRNPNYYIKELVECGEYKIAWDRGILIKRKIDPIKHASLYYGNTYPWRVLAIGPQGTAEYRDGDSWDQPTAVYPTWEYGEDEQTLLELLQYPAGNDIDACTDMEVDGNERPVFGQEHRVVILNSLGGKNLVGRKFLTWLKEVQEEFPDAIIHYHGAYSYRIAFGLGFAASDMDPRTEAAKGKVVLPSGEIKLHEHLMANVKWITNMGFKPNDLTIPRNRCMYNIKSARWAGDHFAELFNIRTRNDVETDVTTPDASYKHPVTKLAISPKALAKAQEGDKVTCDFCSLRNDCKHFRIGAVCSLPNAEPKRLAELFNTRDADVIIDGLGNLMAVGADRLQEAKRMEDVIGEIDPEVTKMLNQLFQQGTTMAKLLDPKYRGGAVKVNIGTGAGSTNVQVNGGSNALIAGVVRQLEKQGIPRNEITPAMIGGLLEEIGTNQEGHKVIEG